MFFGISVGLVLWRSMSFRGLLAGYVYIFSQCYNTSLFGSTVCTHYTRVAKNKVFLMEKSKAVQENRLKCYRYSSE